MRKYTAAMAAILLCLVLFMLSGCQSNNTTINPQETDPTATQANNGLINGWLSTYDYWMDNEMVCFDWSAYQPSTGTAYICYERQFSNELNRHTSLGNSTMESVEQDRIYRIAIWYGESSLINNVRESSIPEYAWHYFYIYNGKVFQSDKESFYQGTPVRTCDSKPPTAVLTPSPTARPYRPRPTEKPKPTATPKPTKAPDYSWYLQFTGINTSENDNYTYTDNLRVGDSVYFHAHLTGGAPNEKVLLYYEICMNGEFIESSAFSGSFGDNSDIWVRNSPFRYGTLSIRVFYYANNGNGREIELGRTSVHINAREDNTQTEISKGWIRSADVYFNRYNNLCFDLTNYNADNKAIIWFSRNENSSNTTQSTVVGGQIIWDSPVPGVIYQYAIWVGDYSVSQDVATLGANQIPSSAWIKLYVTDDKQVVIVSSDVAINIKENEQ